MPEQLFVYGTLIDPIVQFAVFGRATEGRPDRLADFEKSDIRLGDRVYPVIKPEPGSSVEGLAITVTPTELGCIDQYEGENYRRTKVTLASGRQAWVYQA
jgi:gamma-glutamylcyclotransferase (GGCT)/AIG2-like uncharacterized protein YtfP